MPVLTYRDAVRQAMTEEMNRDDNVFLMGEEVAEYNGAYKVSQGMLDVFGPNRIIDTPISEEGFAGMGIGAAMVGLRPIIEFMTFSFSLVAIDQVVNNAANMRYMSGGQLAVPIVFRGPSGMPGSLAATHSHRLEAWYAQIPGLTVIMPSTPADAKGLLKSAIRSDDPVVFMEHEGLYHEKGEVPDGEHLVPIGTADIKRPGSDVTLITYSRCAQGDPRGGREARRGKHRRRGHRPADHSPARPGHAPDLGQEDKPRRHRRGGLALLRPRCGDLRSDHAERLRRARRPDPPGGLARMPRSPTTRASKTPCCRPSTGSSPRCIAFCISRIERGVREGEARMMEGCSCKADTPPNPPFARGGKGRASLALPELLHVKHANTCQGEITCRSKSPCQSSVRRWRPA